MNLLLFFILIFLIILVIILAFRDDFKRTFLQEITLELAKIFVVKIKTKEFKKPDVRNTSGSHRSKQ